MQPLHWIYWMGHKLLDGLAWLLALPLRWQAWRARRARHKRNH
jgi:hypothetical protein